MDKVIWPGWKTVRKLGAGPSGEVYEIERENLGVRERAALKVIWISPENGEDLFDDFDADRAERYEKCLDEVVQKYKLMKELNGHDSIVACDGIMQSINRDGISRNILIKMELLTPISAVMQRVSTEQELLKLGRDICSALTACRKQGLIHADIKPENLFMTPDGRFKLGDFGFGLLDADPAPGVSDFMAPELCRGEPFGASADLYSLGMVMYWLLNEGKMPFEQLMCTTLAQLPPTSARSDALQLRLRGASLPPPKNGSQELKDLVLKACACRPEARFQSAQQMREELDKISPEPGRTPDRFKIKYNVDMVFCIDVTGSMDNLISIVQNNALNLYRDVRVCMEEKGKHIDTLRVRIVAFRDYLADGADAMLTTNFFTLPRDADDLRECVNGLIARGGGDDPEDGYEALAYAIRSKWNTKGTKRRHIIALWTDDDAHDLGFGKSSVYYPKGMAKDVRELTAWWGNDSDPGYMDQEAKRLILFAPDMPHWQVISQNWEKVLHYPSEAGNGLKEKEYKQIISIIAQTI